MRLAHAQHGCIGAEGHGFRFGNHGDFQAGSLIIEGFDRDGGGSGSDGINAAVLHAEDAFVADGVADSVALRAGIEAGGQGRAVAHTQRGRACAELDAAGSLAHRHLAAGGQAAGCGDGDGGAARAHAGDRAAGLVHLDIAGVGAVPAQFAKEALGRDRADQAVGHAFARADGEGAGAQGDGFRLGHRDLDRSGHARAAGGDRGNAGGDGGQHAVGGNFGDGGVAAAPFDGIDLTVGIGGGEFDLVAGRQLRAGFNRQLQNEARARLRQSVSAVGRCVRGDAQRIQLLCGQGRKIGCICPGNVGQLLMREADLRAVVGFIDFRHIDRARVQHSQLGGAVFWRNAHAAAGGDARIALGELHIVGRRGILGITGHIALVGIGRRAAGGFGRRTGLAGDFGVGRFFGSIIRNACFRRRLVRRRRIAGVWLRRNLLRVGCGPCGCVVKICKTEDCEERFVCGLLVCRKARNLHRSENQQQRQCGAQKLANAVFHAQSTLQINLFPSTIIAPTVIICNKLTKWKTSASFAHKNAANRAVCGEREMRFKRTRAAPAACRRWCRLRWRAGSASSTGGARRPLRWRSARADRGCRR